MLLTAIDRRVRTRTTSRRRIARAPTQVVAALPKNHEKLYQCPVYKTPRRASHATEGGTEGDPESGDGWLLDIWLSTSKDPTHWLQRGACLLAS